MRQLPKAPIKRKLPALPQALPTQPDTRVALAKTTGAFEQLSDAFEAAKTKQANPKLRAAPSWVRMLSANPLFNDDVYQISKGSILGLRLEDKIHSPFDADGYVQRSEARRIANDALAKDNPGKDTFWFEGSGLLDLGSGERMGALPFNALGFVSGGASYGFTAGTVLGFRFSQGFVVETGEDPAAQAGKINSFSLPATSQDAKLLPAGTEIEIRGQGKLHADGISSVELGPTISVASAGLGATAHAVKDNAFEYRLAVTALDGYSKLRVTISSLNVGDTSFLARLRAGFMINTAQTFPGPLSGFLTYLALSLGYQNIDDLVNSYTALTARYQYTRNSQETMLASYDFDLSSPTASAAYEKMFKLSPGQAEQLSKQKDSGVTQVSSYERQTSKQSQADLILFGKTLILHHSSSTERTGTLSQNHQTTTNYQDSLYQKQFKTIFTGNKAIQWEAVSTENPIEKIQKPYFRFHFQTQDGHLGKKATDAFFQFIQNLDAADTDLAPYKDEIENSSRLNLDVDIYFNDQAISRMSKASSEEIQQAYLRANGISRFGILKSYRKFKQQQSFWKKIRSTQIERAMKSCYFFISKRKLENDIVLLKKAEEFQKAIQTFSQDYCHSKISQFFLKLGKENGFNYQPIILALVNVSGRENVQIASISMQTPEITVQSSGQERITHPREIVTGLLQRAA